MRATTPAISTIGVRFTGLAYALFDRYEPLFDDALDLIRRAVAVPVEDGKR